MGAFSRFQVEGVTKQCPSPTLPTLLFKQNSIADLVCACTFDFAVTFFFSLSLPEHFPHCLAAESCSWKVNFPNLGCPTLFPESSFRLMGQRVFCLQDPSRQRCPLCFLLLAAEVSHLVYLFNIGILPAGETVKSWRAHLQCFCLETERE